MSDVVEPDLSLSPDARMGMAWQSVELEDGPKSQNRLHLEPTQLAADSLEPVTLVQAKYIEASKMFRGCGGQGGPDPPGARRPLTNEE